MGKPTILDVLVALVMRWPQSSGLGITNSRTELKSNRTWVLLSPCSAERTMASLVLLGPRETGALSGEWRAEAGVREGKVERRVATEPSGT